MPDSQSSEPGFESPFATVSKIWHFRSPRWRPSWISCINEYLAIDSGGNVSDLVVARNCCMVRMLLGEAELVSEWTCLSGRAKRVKRFERSNGLDTALYKNNLYKANGREKRICKLPVDGWCAETRTAYQFHGCIWHGCPDCRDPESRNPKNEKTRHFGESVSAIRREWDVDRDKAIVADTIKLLANSGYGKTVTNIDRHRNVKYCTEVGKSAGGSFSKKRIKPGR